MIIPFVGQTYQMEATSFDNQRCVNLYPILSETGDSKSVSALRSVSGLLEEYDIGGGRIRGGIESAGRAFFVTGSDFYEVFADGTSTNHGTLDTATSIVSIEENPTQIMIVDDEFGYIFTKATDTLTKITDADFPVPSDLTFQDGYFIVTEADTAFFFISALNNGSSWSSLDKTTVEASPDDLVGCKSDSSNLWMFGTKSTEVYRNTGASAFPFERINGASIETGCAAQGTIAEINNVLLWLGTDENGDAIVWQSSGYNAVRVSTQAIEKKIAEGTNFNESYSWVYHERGHAFYMLQVKGVSTTLCLDLSTMAWHERMYRNTDSANEEQHKGSCHVFFNKKHLVGDRGSGKVFRMSLDYYSDNGDPLVKIRTSPHYDEERRLITHAQFELDMEVGVGLASGQGSDPQIMMKYSDDGGKTWSSELWRSMGKIGEYLTRVKWNKLGRSRDRVYSVEVSDPVFVQINEAYLNNV
jgi:hypothetical protein